MMSAARSGRAFKIAGAALLVLVGIWAGARVHSLRGPVAVHTSVGEASPPAPGDFAADFAGAPPPVARIPERMPDFSLSDRDGKPTSIASWGGRSLILNFWATWCAPCRREIPLLKTLSGEWAGRGVQVVGVAVDYREKVAKYADEQKISYPILVGEEDALAVAARLGVDSPVFPFTVFTDRRGQVVTLYLGELHRPQADLILNVVDNINDDKVDLAEGRRTIAEGLHALHADRPG